MNLFVPFLLPGLSLDVKKKKKTIQKDERMTGTAARRTRTAPPRGAESAPSPCLEEFLRQGRGSAMGRVLGQR